MQAQYHKNNRIWSAEGSGISSIVVQRKNLQSVIVCGGIFASGKAPSVFANEEDNINKICIIAIFMEPSYFLGPAVLWLCRLNILSGLNASLQDENHLDAGHIFWIIVVCEIAIVDTGYQYDGKAQLLRKAQFKRQGLW